MTIEADRTWSLEGFQKTARGWLVLVTDPEGAPTVEGLHECLKACPGRAWSDELAPQQLAELERFAAERAAGVALTG